MVTPTFVDLMEHYPVPADRLNQRRNPTQKEKSIAKQFDFDFFDGDRRYGYGGFAYHPRFWTQTVDLFAKYYGLTPNDAVLDVGCAKGFMLADLVQRVPGIYAAGVDISTYAVARAHETVARDLLVADCKRLPFADSSFDLVISVNTVHNLRADECTAAIQEIERVKRRHAYIVVDGWATPQERADLDSWVLTAETVLHHSDWERLFVNAGYTGDYSFWKVR